MEFVKVIIAIIFVAFVVYQAVSLVKAIKKRRAARKNSTEKSSPDVPQAENGGENK